MTLNAADGGEEGQPGGAAMAGSEVTGAGVERKLRAEVTAKWLVGGGAAWGAARLRIGEGNARFFLVPVGAVAYCIY